MMIGVSNNPEELELLKGLLEIDIKVGTFNVLTSESIPYDREFWNKAP